ncbi:hypothetical protein DFH06DRAFT_1366129 [Mycena polygramma]|nr:hypothetical protein DFH06DRAFT_1366129 [Mycena polygramma]
MATSTSSTNNGSSSVRLLSDPNLTPCPDFGSEGFADIRKAMITALELDEAAAITKLQNGWVKGNEKDKAQWVIQVEADRAQEEANEVLREQERQASAAEAAKLAEEERLEAEKKIPKLGDFDVNRAPSSFVESRISAFAQKKLANRQYCPLYPFTPAGLADASSAVLSSGDDASSIRFGRTVDNQLTVESGPSSSTHKNMLRDEGLTYRDFSLGWHRYIKEIEHAGWDPLHVNSITQFFYGLDTHSLREQAYGDKIIQIYADRYRIEWFDMLGKPGAFNLALLNEELLNKVSNEYLRKLQTKAIAST